MAATADPAVEGRFHLPHWNATNEAFRVFARKMLEQGQAQGELLAQHGLAEKLLEDLAAAVNDFDASVAESNEGRRDHVGARAELKAVSDEVMQLVELLDGLNRYRFSGNAELKAAWESARKVVSGPRAAGDAPVVDQPSVEAPKVEGGVRPAA